MDIRKAVISILQKKNDGFGHDRSETVGASEIGQCARKVGYIKSGVEKDAGASDLNGFAERGNVMEDHFSAPMLEHIVESLGGTMYFHGQANQESLVAKKLQISATPDGLAVGLPTGVLIWSGVRKFSGTLLIEFKSFDPRSNTSKFPKSEHIAQVQQGMGLMRLAWSQICKDHDLPADTPKPDAALIVYVNASDYLDIHNFAIKFDPKVYDNLKARAASIMEAVKDNNVEALAPEGKAGGDCRTCDFNSKCVGWAALVPDKKNDIDEEAFNEIKHVATELRKAKLDEEEAADDRKALEGRLKELMVANQTKYLDRDGVKIGWNTTKGRGSFNRKKAEAVLTAKGYKVDDFITEGKPSESLKVEVEGIE